MTHRHLYAERTIRSRDLIVDAVEVLVQHIDRVECGDEADHVIVVDPRTQRSTVDPDSCIWMVFSADGREVAGYSRADGVADLTVHRPGPWDEALDEIPHQRDWWSWIQVIRETDIGGGPDQTSEAVETVLRHRWAPTRLMATLAPLDIDNVLVSLVDDVGPRPFSRSGGSLLVKRALPTSMSPAGLHQWWVDLFDALSARYRLTTADMVPYCEDDEGFIWLATADGSLPDDNTLDDFVAAMDGEGAETDDWYQDGPAMLVPISGPDLPSLLAGAATHAEALGLSVVEIDPDPDVAHDHPR